MADEGGSKAVYAALLANVGIAVTKFVAFLLTGASSMLAESIHSVADSGNQGLLLLGGKRARRDATPEHPFGYGRERYVYGFVVAIILFSLGGLFALFEAYRKFHEVAQGKPDELLESQWWWVPLLVLTVGLFFEGFSFRTAVHAGNAERGEQSWAQFIRRAKGPELPVILLEDSAALVGLGLALAGVGLSLITGSAMWDAAGTACIGLLLGTVAVILAVEMKSLLIGESATRGASRAIGEAIGQAPGIDSVIHLKTMHLGPEELLVAAKLEVTPTDTASEVARAIDAAEERARAALPDLRLVVYLEPDIRGLDGADRSSLETTPPPD